MTLVQLKPLHDSFYRFVFDKLARLDAVILCEGATDAEVVKAVARKLGVELGEALKWLLEDP